MSDNQLNPRSYRQPVEVTFTFPERIQTDLGYLSVTVRELKASSEARALARAGNDGAKLITELVKESVVCATELDGTVARISTADETIEIFMDRLGPKGRTVLMAAYSNVNQPQQDEIADFLQSAKAVVR